MTDWHWNWDWKKSDIYPDKESLIEAFKILAIRPGQFWHYRPDTRKFIYQVANITSDSKVILMAEDNEACGFTKEISDIVGPEGEFADIDFGFGNFL